MRNVILITGSSSGFGAIAARALANAGHTVYASMRETTGRNAPQVKEVEEYAAKHSIWTCKRSNWMYCRRNPLMQL
jgi:NAD(P)-dependent dehydrogenase (short-subunit alcohol dehydrogenase family)